MLSVVLAAYNGGIYIHDQIASILPQLSTGDELIVSDDGSSDNTMQVVAAFNDTRIKLVENKGPHGIVSNFESALRMVRGDIVFLCDQDDLWTPNKVQVCLKALENADLIVHDLMFLTADGCVSDVGFFKSRNSGPGFWKNLYKNGFMGSCMAFKRSVLDFALPFPKDILWHDMWIGLMAERKCKTLFIPEQLLYYRRHGDNASPTGDKSSFSLLKQLHYRWVMLKNALKR
ncbi:MAG: glycosyltransferase [Aeriscardovia sp.]|nr:glycosyltransferase [Paludibacteraceae bacterium]MBO5632887.1 glycosyltransferase [Aeriscardovia sp.]